jgi:hypothetical protein
VYEVALGMVYEVAMAMVYEVTMAAMYKMVATVIKPFESVAARCLIL